METVKNILPQKVCRSFKGVCGSERQRPLFFSPLLIMAENKKSFILYCDLIHTVDKLPNEKAGELFKHILEYVNDMNPETNDLLVEVVFEPIKRQLKRDLVKFKNICDRNSDKGALGNLKRWNPDLYKKVAKKSLSLQEALVIAADRRSDSGIANVADTDTDTDTDIKENIKRKIFDYWNTLGVIFHQKITPEIERAIQTMLKSRTEDEIKVAIKTYADVVNNPKCYFKHKWTLVEFLTRKNGLPVFAEKRVADYLTNKGEQDITAILRQNSE
jgi:hypothetical protein